MRKGFGSRKTIRLGSHRNATYGNTFRASRSMHNAARTRNLCFEAVVTSTTGGGLVSPVLQETSAARTKNRTSLAFMDPRDQSLLLSSVPPSLSNT